MNTTELILHWTQCRAIAKTARSGNIAAQRLANYTAWHPASQTARQTTNAARQAGEAYHRAIQAEAAARQAVWQSIAARWTAAAREAAHV